MRVRLLVGTIRGLAALNARLLAVGRWGAIACLAVMVTVVLAQVVARYGLDAAMRWPEELSRFLMLWMTGLAAPTALRHGGFVAIETLPSFLPRTPALVLGLVLWTLALVVLLFAFRFGWADMTGLGGRFKLDTLRIPVAWDLSEWTKLSRSWMMASLVLGVALMILVTVELILRQAADLLGAALPALPRLASAEAE
jgi:TRAP-type C4-dicarboxylate transport system permease small subunit